MISLRKTRERNERRAGNALTDVVGHELNAHISRRDSRRNVKRFSCGFCHSPIPVLRNPLSSCPSFPPCSPHFPILNVRSYPFLVTHQDLFTSALDFVVELKTENLTIKLLLSLIIYRKLLRQIDIKTILIT